jgi:hypothetical protein
VDVRRHRRASRAANRAERAAATEPTNQRAACGMKFSAGILTFAPIVVVGQRRSHALSIVSIPCGLERSNRLVALYVGVHTKPGARPGLLFKKTL